MSNISEFERTKPKITMKKLNQIISFVEKQTFVSDSKDQSVFLLELKTQLLDLKKSFKKGE